MVSKVKRWSRANWHHLFTVQVRLGPGLCCSSHWVCPVSRSRTLIPGLWNVRGAKVVGLTHSSEWVWIRESDRPSSPAAAQCSSHTGVWQLITAAVVGLFSCTHNNMHLKTRGHQAMDYWWQTIDQVRHTEPSAPPRHPPPPPQGAVHTLSWYWREPHRRTHWRWATGAAACRLWLLSYDLRIWTVCLPTIEEAVALSEIEW